MLKQLALLFLFIPIIAQGQHWAGIQFGYNYGNFLGGQSTGYTIPSHRIVFGANYEFEFKKYGIFQADLIWQKHKYTNHGESLQTDTSSYIETNQSFYLHYISLPIKLGFKLGEKYAFLFTAGILPGIQVQNEYNARYGSGFPSSTYKNVISDKTSRFRLSALVEAGFEIKALPHLKVFTSLGCYYDLLQTKIKGTVNGLHIKPFKQFGINLQFGVRFLVPQPKLKLPEYRLNH